MCISYESEQNINDYDTCLIVALISVCYNNKSYKRLQANIER